MFIKIPKDWEIPEGKATDPSLYRLRHRREFLTSLGVGAVATFVAPTFARAAMSGFPDAKNPLYSGSDLKETPFPYVISYNNFYEFGTDKADPKTNANMGWKTEPWKLELSGLIQAPATYDVEDLIGKMGGIEQRVYRHRCVEAWSMVIPWDGFALSKLIALAQPKPEAKYLKFTSFLDPEHAIGQQSRILDWPYVEGLRLDEANNELAFIATGIYGKPLQNQNGAPIRLVVPWKYGFKDIKSLVKIEFTDSQPANTWNVMAPNEYGFYANVNPTVDHPRWSQAEERVIGGGFFSGKQPTLMFNGYSKQVAGLYAGLDLRKNF